MNKVLDKEIIMKQLRLRVAVVEEAVLKHGIDIDRTLQDYDQFLAKKLKQKIKTREADIKMRAYNKTQEELELKAKFKQR